MRTLLLQVASSAAAFSINVCPNQCLQKLEQLKKDKHYKLSLGGGNYRIELWDLWHQEDSDKIGLQTYYIKHFLGSLHASSGLWAFRKIRKNKSFQFQFQQNCDNVF
ncbi:hypothetical protein VNO77_13445 [Canavalia gladiata]|uniref:Uncharacterized protein n=1 Tax=Canavalia gladiata TaxID=3824 RepID=A0AAN9QNB9_CANGL